MLDVFDFDNQIFQQNSPPPSARLQISTCTPLSTIARLRFNTGEASYGPLTVSIVLNVGDKVVGMVVDAVSDVISLQPDQIRPAPDFGGAISTKFMTGIASVDDRLITLLDVPSLLWSADVSLDETAFA